MRLIVDTDAGFDVDDVGALAVANALQDNGECEIVAVAHTNGCVAPPLPRWAFAACVACVP